MTYITCICEMYHLQHGVRLSTMDVDWRNGRKELHGMTGSIPLSQRTWIALLLAVAVTTAAVLAVSRFAVLLNADLATPGVLLLLLVVTLAARQPGHWQ